MIRRSCHGTGVQHYNVGCSGIFGALKAPAREFALKRSSIGLGGAAAEVLNNIGGHKSIIEPVLRIFSWRDFHVQLTT